YVLLVTLRIHNLVNDVYAGRLRLIAVIDEFVGSRCSGLVSAVSHSLNESGRRDELEAFVAGFLQTLNIAMLCVQIGHQRVQLIALCFGLSIFFILHSSRAHIWASGWGFFYLMTLEPLPKSTVPFGQKSQITVKAR